MKLAEIITIGYTNHRGEFANRNIVPTGKITFESNKWHPVETWLLEAYDIDKRAIRTFEIIKITAPKPHD